MKCPYCNGTGDFADPEGSGLSRGQIANLETGRTDLSLSLWHGKWRIYVASADAKAFGGHSYEFVHEDYDPTPNNPGDGPGDDRAGYAASVEGAKAQIDDMEEDAILTSSSCPKCGLEAKTLLHRFCQHASCPVRAALQKAKGESA